MSEMVQVRDIVSMED